MKRQIVTLLQQYQAGRMSEAELKREYARLREDEGAQAATHGERLAAGAVPCRRVMVDGPGSIDDMRVVETWLAPPSGSEVLVDTVAFSLNFGDLLCLKGLYPTMPAYPFTPGFEAAGVVRAVGERVRRFAPGDPVIVTASPLLGIQSSVIVADEAQLVDKPPFLDYEQAASLLTVGLTVVEAFRRMRLAAGDTILIQSATGGTGLVAVQLALHAGATVIATASAAAKLDYLRAMGVHHTIHYVEQDFEAEVMRLTGGRGVDVVLNALAGDYIQKGLNCLSPRGRYVEIAMTGLKSARNIDLSRLSNNQSFHSLDLRKLLLDLPSYAQGLGEELFEFAARGVVNVPIGQRFDFSRLADAYRYIEDRRNIGKVVVGVAGPHTPERATPKPLAARAFAPAPGAAAATATAAEFSSPAAQAVSCDAPIAIIGMSGRFGAAGDIDAFWRCVADGVSLIGPLPPERAALFRSLEAGEAGKLAHRGWSSHLEAIEAFDPLFFNISGVEARHMDPQQRLFLEESWRALEDAGLTPARLDGSRTGVYAGAADSKYGSYVREDEVGHSFWGTAPSILPARVAYFLNLKGPAVTIDTACSSSLVAIHLGCESLRNHETDLILAGGAFLQATPHFGAAAGNAQMLAADGKCHTFDDRANGMVSGEAVAVLVLKRLDEARADGDRIHGVIVGSGINQDGATNGITAPSALAQQQLQTDVYARFGIDPDGIQYVEAHGTGTSLGDPIEMRALTDAFRRHTERRGYCAIGSVKTNVGHTVTAAGVTGVVKVLMAMRHRLLPALLNYEVPNRHIDFETSPFFVNTEALPWTPAPGGVLRAAVSSFGFSGTNAHLVLESHHDARAARAAADAPQLLVLSARTPERLRAHAARVAGWLAANPACDLEAVACTLQTGREAMSQRVALVARDAVDAAHRLARWAQREGADDGDHGLLLGQVKRPGAVLDAQAVRALLDETGREGGLRELARRWVEGMRCDWQALYPGERPLLADLPTYPFAREPYWAAPLAEDGEGEGGALDAAVVSPAAEVEKKAEWVDSAHAAGLAEAADAAGEAGPSLSSARMLEPVWLAGPAAPALEAPAARWILVEGEAARVIVPEEASTRVIALADSDASSARHSLARRYTAQVGQVFALLREWLATHPRTPLRVQLVRFGEQAEGAALDGVIALLKSLSRENPLLSGQAIRMPVDVAPAVLAQRLDDDARRHGDREIRYRADGVREVLTLRAWPETEAPSSPWREGGVYLITGGVGGLGRLLAGRLAATVQGVKLVLAGRRAASAETDEVIGALHARAAASGGSVRYVSLDVTDAPAVHGALADIVAREGALHGVLHAAGLIDDAYALRKTAASLDAVLAPKVAGTVNLDAASAQLDLDCFVLFSSIAGVWGNVGQGDYAAANAFEDGFARYRASLVEAGLRRGASVSVAWPWWAEGGMRLGEEAERALREAGWPGLGTEPGMRLLSQAVTSGRPCAVVLGGEPAGLGLDLDLAATAPVAALAAREPGHEVDAQWRERVVQRLKVLFASVTQLPVSRIDSEEALESYGIDSVLITRLNRELEKTFEAIPKTLWFEYPTLAGLAGYLSEHHAAACLGWVGAVRATAAAAAEPRPRDKLAVEARKPAPTIAAEARPREGIAIIGLAGRYPQAPDLNAYWENLREGRDCITEIPAERWSLDGFYCEDVERAVSEGLSYSKWGGFIEGFADFDPLFFNLSPREAEGIDPQERLFMQTCWHVIEDAGYTRDSLARRHGGRVGVFAGITKTGFELHGPELWRRGVPAFPRTSFSSVANRVSYFLNLHGPSLPIDTMCSSSLTAIHEACEHLLRDECELAIAGGVNLYLHPSSYVMLCLSRMLSPRGRCRSFGEGGDGMVPGEGVGAVLLKRLSAAEADGDRIHGVIRASAINHGGKTNGYTVPNPGAQRELIVSALAKSGIEARDIGYVEAHGTGTELGDPIEIAGLSQAYGDTGGSSCAIGSAKSNIGHAESAAGIAGLTKVLLQMRHGELAPSLHAQRPNPHIDFGRTPFRLQTGLSAWPRPVREEAGERRERPRIAAISSFGAGGANAHLIVEEYRDRREQPASGGEGEPSALVLSAKSEGQLREVAERLLAALREGDWSDADLADIAYTLQVGREAFEHRLALVAGSIAEAIDELDRFVRGIDSEGERHLDDIRRHKDSKDTLDAFAADDDLRGTLDSWFDKRKYPRLLDLWVKGVDLDWGRLHDGRGRRRVPLPTYPFASERLWLALEPKPASVTRDKPFVVLHPLLHRNTSNFDGQRFSSEFDGEEFFLREHVVDGMRLLPGSAYVEMARAAWCASSEADLLAPLAVTLRGLTWLKPVAVETAPVSVHLWLDEDEHGAIAFEVEGDTPEAGEAPVFCRGEIGWLDDPERSAPAALDLDALRAECARLRLSPDQCYAVFDASGIAYGSSFRTIVHAEVGHGQALLELALSEARLADLHRYLLHPALLDGALQGCACVELGAAADEAAPARPMLLFAIDRIDLLGACGARMWAAVRRTTDRDAAVRRYDIDLCDDAGRIQARLSGVSARVLDAGATTADSARGDTALLLAPTWERLRALPEPAASPRLEGETWLAASADMAALGMAAASAAPRRLVDPHGASVEALAAQLRGSAAIAEVIWVAPDAAATDAGALDARRLREAQTRGVLACLRLIKALLMLGCDARPLRFVAITSGALPVIPRERIDPAHAGVHGLVGALANEYPKWTVTVADIEPGSNPQALPAPRRWPGAQAGASHAWRHGAWYRQALARCECPAPGRPVFREGGVYLIVGGAGGIGEVLSEQLILRHRAQLVWLGRRPEDAAITARLDRLAELGPRPRYLRADATRRDALAPALAELRARHPVIHGVIHSAVGLFDESLAGTTPEHFAEVLAAKTEISINLADLFADAQLDFMLFFSGLNAFSRDAGKSGYAAGCVFKDALAERLNQARPYPVKVVNWGWWGEVGAAGAVPQAYRNRVELAGVRAIDADDAMLALERLLGGPFERLGLLRLTHDEARRWTGAAPATLRGLVPGVTASVRAALPGDEAVAPPVENASTSEFRRVDDGLGTLLAAVLDDAGLLSVAADSAAGAAADTRLGVDARWLRASLDTLALRGLAAPAADRAARARRLAEAWASWEAGLPGWLANPDLRAQVRLVDTMLRALPAILGGTTRATDVMFPNASMALVEDIYKNNAAADHFNALLTGHLVRHVEALLARDPSGPIRILEIGAGTGGTSRGVFEALAPYRERIAAYTYTDMSQAFLMHAREHYAARAPYLDCRIFDVEQAPRAQGIEIGTYQVVIAANVLHATRDIRDTLAHAKAALAPGGLLLLNEITAFSLFAHLSFGLLEGWWRYEDAELRLPGTPALGVEGWCRALAETGFVEVVTLPAQTVEIGQRIIVAHGDAIVREAAVAPTRQAAGAIEPARGAEPASMAVPATRGKPVASGEPAASRVPVAPAAAADGAAGPSTDARLREAGIERLRELVGRTLKLPPQRIDVAEPFERYGIDSILVVQLTDAIKDSFPGITSTVFFEYRTIIGLVDHLLATRRDALCRLTGFRAETSAAALAVPAALSAAAVPPAVQARPVAVARGRRRSRRAAMPATATTETQAPGREAPRREGIAIIGLAGRYPQAPDLNAYWENLREGRDCVTEIPAERWSLDGFYCEDVEQAVSEGLSYSKWGGFIEGFADFDPLFFNLSPREAEGIDPQERLFMQTCWHVIEDAGYTRDSLARRHGGRVGVFAGITKTGFELHGPELWRRGVPAFPRTSFSSVANRVSYFLNLHGPSLPIDTMCSSSLTAIHEACEHLLRDECELAIAGGVNLYLHPSSYVMLCLSRMLSPRGRCRSFGEGGDGMVPGEGVGAVLLKRLSAAEADGDRIHGVIRASAINHGGKTNGYTVPNPGAQRELIVSALAKSGIEARDIGYVEAHGTGTELGDPIEIAGLSQAYGDTGGSSCAIGSAKSNIGHAESAAGIAGLTKVLLQMRHGELAPSLHAQRPNPHIDFGRTPFRLQTALSAWPRPVREEAGERRERPRIAAISSFGAGGSNAHLIVEEYRDRREQPASSGEEEPSALVLSAKSEGQLREVAERLLAALREGSWSDADLADIAYTLQVGREAFEHRLALVAKTLDDAIERLDAWLAGRRAEAAVFEGDTSTGNSALALLSRDDTFEAAVRQWLAQRKLSHLLELWVAGLEIDWTPLHAACARRPVGLPLYPFAGERYWLPVGQHEGPLDPDPRGGGGGRAARRDAAGSPGHEAHAGSPADADALASASADQAMPLLDYEETWVAAPVAATAAGGTPPDGVRRLLHFTARLDGDDALTSAFAARGEPVEVIRVSLGEREARLAADHHMLAGTDEAALRRLFAALAQEHEAAPLGIVYGWQVGQPRLAALHALLRAAAAEGAPLRRLVVLGKWGTDLSSCDDQAVIGLIRSLRLSMPQVGTLALFGDDMSPGATEIAAEWRASGEVLRYGAAGRERLSWRAVPVDAATPASGARAAGLRERGAYLITGGAGGLGRLLATHLARRYHARLAVLGRRQPDASTDALLAQLRELGASDAVYHAVDVADSHALSEIVAGLRARWQGLHGVIHAAGVESRGSLLERTASQLEAVVSPKVAGTRALDQATASEALDFFCCFSSSSAVLGDGGAGDYAGANRYQLAFAAHRNARVAAGERAGRTVSPAWPLWRDGGMGAVESEGVDLYLRSSGQRFLERDEGLAAWERLLVAGPAQDLVLAGDRARLERALDHVCRGYAVLDADWGAPASRPAPPRVAAEIDPAALMPRAVEIVKAGIEAILKLPPERVRDGAQFADIGFDSVGLAQLARWLGRELAIDLTPAVFFDYSTVTRLAAHLRDSHPLALAGSDDEAVGSGPDAPSRALPAVTTAMAAPATAAAMRPVPAPPDQGGVAIIGVSVRTAGANDAGELWELLRSGRRAIGEVPASRWDWRPYFSGPGEASNRIATHRGAFIEGLDGFDPLFFEISPREAQWMDPRQRLILEEAWRAFEDAGYAGERLRGSRCGVFIGVEEGVPGEAADGLATSHHNGILAARISYVLDLKGPNLAINTACSSGLVAVHTACQSVQRGECELALAGGVNVLNSPLTYVALTQGGMLSSSGECHAFDARADGMVPGEAVAAVVLKDLARAQADGDPIHGVIRASGVNYDGRTNGITAPSARSQRALISEVLERGGVEAERIEAVLAHSVGSPLGDPIEARALCEALGEGLNEGLNEGTQTRVLGSVKPQIGHTFAASGVVNVIAMCASLRHELRLGIANHEVANPDLRIGDGALSLGAGAQPWPKRAGVARCGLVSATGMSGTNACVVIEEAPEAASGAVGKEARREWLVKLSARESGALRESARRLRAWLGGEAGAEVELDALSL
ncbi:SDR family NAD(P)-dependent oxidoreductase, partial [Burkholderia gladioli]|uniref:SDR family NAD(P)-dependent oxidoreductase n=3 Tax=Burkholderia gladioli TaxID=28095 RepID=UPI001C228F01|nr:SDR family NAD(P)-dependent oxidoreductase [Burkholderia gladioli]